MAVSGVVSIIVAIVYMAVMLCIPVLIGVYVYRDAKRRGMNAVLWTLIAILAPTLIGFIVYLLVRGSYSDLSCPECGERITEEYAVCPNCAARLRPSCPACSAPVKPEWNVCPICGSALPQSYDDIKAPVVKKDKALGKILAMVVVIPIVLIAAAFVLFSASSGSAGTLGVTSLPADEYLQENGNPEIAAWLDGISQEQNTAYILRNTDESGDETNKTMFLIYIPSLRDLPKISISQNTGLFGETVDLRISNSTETGGNTVILVTCDGESQPRLSLHLEEKNLKQEITDVDYSLELMQEYEAEEQ